MAIIELEKMRYTIQNAEGKQGTIEVVDVCIVTNSTLERSFLLSIVLDRSSAKNSKYIFLSHSHLAFTLVTSGYFSVMVYYITMCILLRQLYCRRIIRLGGNECVRTYVHVHVHVHI